MRKTRMWAKGLLAVLLGMPSGAYAGGVEKVWIETGGFEVTLEKAISKTRDTVTKGRIGRPFPPRLPEYPGNIRPQASSLQGVVNQCALPMYVPPILTALDFVQVYDYCLKATEDFGISHVTVPPDRHVPGSVWVFSHASQATREAMNGTVTVAGEGGPLTVTIWAYPDIQMHSFETSEKLPGS